MALKKRILQNINQSETVQFYVKPQSTSTLEPIIVPAHKIRVLELSTKYWRFTNLQKRLQTLSTLQEYTQVLIEFTNRLILFKECIEDCYTMLVQQMIRLTDPNIQVIFINALTAMQKIFPTENNEIVKELTHLLKQTTSIKVTGSLLTYFSVLSSMYLSDKELTSTLAKYAIQYSIDSHIRIQICALKLLGKLGQMPSIDETVKSDIINKLLETIEHDDPCVRAEALRTIVMLYKCEIGLNLPHYNYFLECLQDHYSEIRLTACEALFLLAINMPESSVPLSSLTAPNDESKLINQVFRLVCDQTNDEAKNVRVQAMQMIGKLCRHGVDINLVHQTLDKKLLRITKRKELIAKVEQLDSEMEDIAVHDVTVDAESVSITAIGPCGALISGLEDEYSEVRAAAVNSCYDISCGYDVFLSKIIEYIVSMFDDDIEHVRLLAMRTLGKIANGKVLRGEQVISILTELLSRSYDIRSALHDVLRVVKIGDPTTLHQLFHRLVENIQRFKTDTYSVLRCLKELGQNNSAFIALLLPKLLPMHLYLDVQEPRFSKIDHTCTLILVLNAALNHPSIVSVLPDYVLRHYRYLRTKEPDLTPNLQGSSDTSTLNIFASLPTVIKSSHDVFERISKKARQSQELHPSDRQKFYRALAAELHKVAEMDSDLLPASECTALYYEILALIIWQCTSRNCLKAITLCKHLLTVFRGYTDEQLISIQQLHFYCHMLLLSVQTSSDSSTIPLFVKQRWHKHIRWIENNSLLKNKIFDDLELNDKTNLIYTNILGFIKARLPIMSKSLLNNSITFNNNIQMTSVTFIEPDSDIDNAIEFLPGLSTSIQCLMNAKYLDRKQQMNIKVTYLDGRYCLIPINDENIRTLAEDGSLRIDSKITFSHQYWLRPCYATFSVVLFPRESNCFIMDINEEFLEITKPIRVLLHPKYQRYRKKKNSMDGGQLQTMETSTTSFDNDTTNFDDDEWFEDDEEEEDEDYYERHEESPIEQEEQQDDHIEKEETILDDDMDVDNGVQETNQTNLYQFEVVDNVKNNDEIER